MIHLMFVNEDVSVIAVLKDPDRFKVQVQDPKGFKEVEMTTLQLATTMFLALGGGEELMNEHFSKAFVKAFYSIIEKQLEQLAPVRPVP